MTSEQLAVLEIARSAKTSERASNGLVPPDHIFVRAAICVRAFMRGSEHEVSATAFIANTLCPEFDADTLCEYDRALLTVEL
jgi:hypothetical protein